MSDEESLMDERMTILVVDDTSENLTVTGEVLRPFYRVLVATSGPRALQIVDAQPRPDLILLDIMMPEMDGYAVMMALQGNPKQRDIPVIFVTALDDDVNEEFGLGLGAVDYVTKPIRPALLLARIRSQLALKKARDDLTRQKEHLEAEVRRRVAEVAQIKDASLHALAALAQKRDA